ncbi:ras and Rab interactor 1 isoform X2 [Microcaecilia unicolor]|uniref:Ras and Rab interactor 1 isoform X2 n=1 Tax=Microcaecilia unicolor TaxID=1415580 RepID=A0A6P7Z6S4_9AMPH|nr:ras and Rab interactor 1 isoform X2 [Microcaecilia unicolor]
MHTPLLVQSVSGERERVAEGIPYPIPICGRDFSVPACSPGTPPQKQQPEEREGTESTLLALQGILLSCAMESQDLGNRVSQPCPSSQSRPSTDPVYDYPDSCSSHKPIHRGSLKSISVLDRLLLTQSVWLPLTVNSATALHILQREPPGTFLVRKSKTEQRKVLCVRLSDTCQPSFVTHFYIQEGPSGISLEGSNVTFPDLFRLIASYCVTREVLPSILRLPEAIVKATSHKQLEAISHLGVEFWNSSLNAKEPNIGSNESPNASLPTSISVSDCITPQQSAFSFHQPLKTRGPLELVQGTGNGALCFFNPLFQEQGLGNPGSHSSSSGVKRSQFQRSFKVRVSTENSSPLSPPLNPPPPIPASELQRHKELAKTMPPPLPQRETSNKQDYKQPRVSLRARLRRKLSKGSVEEGTEALQALSPTLEEEYQIPKPAGVGGPEEELSEAHSEDSVEGLEFECQRLPSLQEVDSSSLSSLEEVETSSVRHQYASPQPRRKSSQLERRVRVPLRAVSEVFFSFLSPEKKLLKVAEEMAQDRETGFGNLVQDFLRLIREELQRETPGLLGSVRQFLTQAKNFLRESAELEVPLATLLTEADQDRVLEKAIHRSILKPLKPHLDFWQRRLLTQDGSLRQLQENLLLVQQKGPQALEVRAGLPDVQGLEKIRLKLLKIRKRYSPTDKMFLLLQASKLIYTSMTTHSDDTYGADDFLPVLAYVLALCNIPELLLEVEYMMELLDPLLLMGGYYLTSLCASLSILRGYHEQPVEGSTPSQEFKRSLKLWHRRREGLPSVNDFQNFLRIGYQDPENGCTSKTLLVRPSDTVDDLLGRCAKKFQVSQPEAYGIFLYTNESYQRLGPKSRPQEMKSELQSQGGSFYFVYCRVEDEEKDEEAAKDGEQKLTSRDASGVEESS